MLKGKNKPALANSSCIKCYYHKLFLRAITESYSCTFSASYLCKSLLQVEPSSMESSLECIKRAPNHQSQGLPNSYWEVIAIPLQH